MRIHLLAPIQLSLYSAYETQKTCPSKRKRNVGFADNVRHIEQRCNQT